jgi:hypothetical protein
LVGRRAATEQAIADAMLASLASRPAQSGLFELAAARNHAALSASREDLIRSTRRAIRDLEEAALVEVGPAELAIVWTP